MIKEEKKCIEEISNSLDVKLEEKNEPFEAYSHMTTVVPFAQEVIHLS